MGSISKLGKKLFLKYEMATEADFEEISKLLEVTYKHSMKENGFEFNHAEDFIENLKNIAEIGGKTFVARYHKNIIGTISYKPKSLDKWYYSGDAIEMCHLAVLPEYQSSGIGGTLFDMARDEINQNYELPIVFVTPEKNFNVVKYYERKGFSKVVFFKAGTHYTVRFIQWNGEKPFTDEEIKEKYKKIAMKALMKHYLICEEIADPELKELWSTQFADYYKSQTEEVQLQMRKQYNQNNITPKEFLENK